MTTNRQLIRLVIIAAMAAPFAEAQTTTMPMSPDDAEWWQSFGDESLNRLITTAIDNNYNIDIAARRIAMARNAAGEARAGWMPTVGLTAGWNKERTSGAVTRGVGPARESAWQAGLTMNWEIDIFGKIASGVKGKEALVRASKADYDATMLSVAAQVADTYSSLRQAQKQLAVAQAHCESQAKVEKIAEARMEAGIGSGLDVAQAKVVLYSTRASVPQLNNAIEQSINTLANLLGVDAESLTWLTNSIAELPDYRRVLAEGVPMDLLRRRPDVAEAEAQVEAYAAELGVARKDYLPSLTLTGQMGSEARNAKDLMGGDSWTYSIAPTLSWTIFDGLSRRNASAAARQQMEIGIDNYNATLQTAVTEARNALSAYRYAEEQIALYGDVLEQSRKALDLSLSLYKQGLTDFTDVAQAQESVLEYEMTLIQSEAAAFTSLIDIYKAFGGGWY